MKSSALSDVKLLIILALSLRHVHSYQIFCHKNEDCPVFNNCGEKQRCVHKSFLPIDKSEYIGFIIIFIGSAISNAGGIGGGGLLIPILLVFFSFEPEEAIPLSKIMIFAGALTSFILGFNIKHPTREQISIDYNIPLILIPLLLFGTMTGVILSKVIHHNVILISLTLFLVINTFTTMSKGIKQFNQETEEIERKKKSLIEYRKENQNTDSEALLDSDRQGEARKKNDDLVSGRIKRDKRNNNKELTTDEEYKTDKSEKTSSYLVNVKSTDTMQSDSDSIVPKFRSSGQNRDFLNQSLAKKYQMSQNNKEVLRLEKEKDLEKFPIDKYFYFFLCYCVMIFVTLLKGTSEFKSLVNIENGSVSYWLVFSSYFIFAVLINFIISRKILTEYDFRKRKGYKYTEYDVKWTMKIMLVYPLFGFMCGMFAGLLGIGGGLIMGPLLLDLGLHPIVSTATSNFLVLFISSSTSIQFIFMGMLNYNYAFPLVLVSSLGSLIGTLLIQKLFFYTGRSSILILVLGLVLGIAAVVIPIHSVYKYMHLNNQLK